MKQVNIGILGATGAVGQEMIKILEERNFPVASVLPISRSISVLFVYIINFLILFQYPCHILLYSSHILYIFILNME